jgi:secreted PhoX family phosphatase
MDRPEWGAVDPITGEVCVTLTNNTRRTQAQVDAANPRAGNPFGQIIRWTEARGEHSATGFTWELFVIAGNVNTSRDLAGRPLNADSIFACPDGLWFDPDGRLWIQTDIGESAQNRGALEPVGNNAMLCADPRTGEIRRFPTGPTGQEVTGVVSTPACGRCSWACSTPAPAPRPRCMRQARSIRASPTMTAPCRVRPRW